MSQNPPEKPLKSRTAAEERERRRAEALRANLRRRKAARAEGADQPPQPLEPDGE